MLGWRSRQQQLLRLLSLLPPVLVACGEAEQDQSETSARESWIAFVTDRDGNGEICVMKPDGSQIRNLTRNEASDSDPSWSPDGRRLAFRSDRVGSQIYVMNADGTGVTKVTDTPEKKSMPTWSPDGTQIAFTATQNSNLHIHVVSLDEGQSTKLVEGMAPSWSPDGTTLAFNRGQLPHIWLVDADGTNARRLMGDPSKQSPEDRFAQLFSLAPIWSPDGEKLLYTKVMSKAARGTREMNYEVFTMDRDGSSRKRLTTDPAWEMGNGWSPDGQRIVFTAKRDGNAEIYVMNADGTGQTNLTRHEANDQLASWSPLVAK